LCSVIDPGDQITTWLDSSPICATRPQLTQTMFTGVGEQVGDAQLFGQLSQFSVVLVIEKLRIQPVLLAAVLYR
ncbi:MULTISPECIES: hypothetical protein, partial [unclassified Aeromonas]|uniref:hypothetical protein n=1 Tax=unclassified Aeromonas TaxID=257493 RepID=UPI0022E03A51